MNYHSSSMGLAMGIGFFQLDNLIRNKVPFVLLSEDLPYEELFLGPALLQVQGVKLDFSESDSHEIVLQKIRELPQYQSLPLVVVTRREEVAQDLAEFLASQGFLNSCYVEGGFAALKSEAVL